MKLVTPFLMMLPFLAAACGGRATRSATMAAPSDGQNVSVPRPVDAFSVDDQAALRGFLTSLIEAEEGVKANVPNAPEDEDLRIFFQPGKSPCQRTRDALACDVFYERGRWNGTLHAELTLSGSRAATLVKADFAGSF